MSGTKIVGYGLEARLDESPGLISVYSQTSPEMTFLVSVAATAGRVKYFRRANHRAGATARSPMAGFLETVMDVPDLAEFL